MNSPVYVIVIFACIAQHRFPKVFCANFGTACTEDEQIKLKEETIKTCCENINIKKSIVPMFGYQNEFRQCQKDMLHLLLNHFNEDALTSLTKYVATQAELNIVNNMFITEKWDSQTVIKLLSTAISNQRGLSRVQYIEAVVMYARFEWWKKFLNYEFTKTFYTNDNIHIMLGHKIRYFEIYYNWWERERLEENKNVGCSVNAVITVSDYFSRRTRDPPSSGDIEEVYEILCKPQYGWNTGGAIEFFESPYMLQLPLQDITALLKEGIYMLAQCSKNPTWQVPDMMRILSECKKEEEAGEEEEEADKMKDQKKKDKEVKKKKDKAEAEKVDNGLQDSRIADNGNRTGDGHHLGDAPKKDKKGEDSKADGEDEKKKKKDKKDKKNKKDKKSKKHKDNRGCTEYSLKAIRGACLMNIRPQLFLSIYKKIEDEHLNRNMMLHAIEMSSIVMRLTPNFTMNTDEAAVNFFRTCTKLMGENEMEEIANVESAIQAVVQAGWSRKWQLIDMTKFINDARTKFQLPFLQFDPFLDAIPENQLVKINEIQTLFLNLNIIPDWRKIRDIKPSIVVYDFIQLYKGTGKDSTGTNDKELSAKEHAARALRYYFHNEGIRKISTSVMVAMIDYDQVLVEKISEADYQKLFNIVSWQENMVQRNSDSEFFATQFRSAASAKTTIRDLIINLERSKSAA